MPSTFSEKCSYLYNTLWNIVWPGSVEFTADKYPDLSGQTWIVTGATGGIGLEVAKILAGQNAKVWLMGRNEEKLASAVNSVRSVGKGSVEWFVADYDDLATIKPGVAKFLKAETRLDGVIHNAGVFHAPADAVTVQGLNKTIGVNDVAPHLLQKLLDPLTTSTPDSRIIWLSSVIHSVAPPGGVRFNNLHRKDISPMARYAESKALDYITAVQWSKHHPQSTTKSIAAHPGIIDSDLYRDAGLVGLLLKPFMYDNWHGAQSPIFAALSPDVPNNAYTVPFGKVGVMRRDIIESANGELGDKIWQWLEESVAPYV